MSGIDWSSEAMGNGQYVNKGLRAVLGRPVASPYSRGCCGAGTLRSCRVQLRRSLEAAVARVVAFTRHR